MHYTKEKMKSWVTSGDTALVIRKIAEDWLELHAENDRLRERNSLLARENGLVVAENKWVRAEIDRLQHLNEQLHIHLDDVKAPPADAQAENELLQGATAAVVEAWERSVLNMGVGRMHQEITNLRIVAGIPTPPTEKKGGE